MGVLRNDGDKAADEQARANDTRVDAPTSRVSERAQLARDGVLDAAGARESSGQILLACARHELRSPLQWIQGFAELLESDSYGGLSEDQHSFVEHILQGSKELGAMLEACFELAELELVQIALEREISVLHGVLDDALSHAKSSQELSLATRYAPESRGARVWLERATLRRSLNALFRGLAAKPGLAFHVDVSLDGAQACILIGSPKRMPGATMITVNQLIERQRSTRSLLWLRLAEQLLGLQDARVVLSESLDCAEVRIPLSSPH